MTIEGVVTSETGAILDLRTVAVQDDTGGILVLLPTRDAPVLVRGDLVTATGKLASRSGALQISVSAAGDVGITGADLLPGPRGVGSSDLGESVEGLLVRSSGVVSRVTRATSGAATLVLDDSQGSFTVSCWHPCATGVRKGARLQATGIAGQRWTRSGAADGYRIWPRDAADVIVLAPGASDDPAAGGDGAGTGEPDASEPPADAAVSTIAAARTRPASEVTVEATVTTTPGYIDPDTRRVVAQDGSGAILVRLPADSPTVAIGDRIRLKGRVGTYGSAPQFAAADVVAVSHGPAPAPVALSAAPASGDEWRLVRVDGRVQAVRRYGTTWRAEIRLAGAALVAVQGTSRSGVPSTALVEGRDASVVGIVRRPSSGASDQRFAVLPRFPADVALGPGDTSGSPGSSGTAGTATGTGQYPAGTAAGSGATAASDRQGAGAMALDIDLADLGAHPGELVRVGGFVSSVSGAGLQLDDGTGIGNVRLEGDALDIGSTIETGETLNVTGSVERTAAGGSVVVVRDPAMVARVGRLGESVPLLASAGASAATRPGDGQELRQVAELRVGPVAMAVPGGPASWILVVLTATLTLGAVAVVVARRRLRAERERSGRGIVARLSELLAVPVGEVAASRAPAARPPVAHVPTGRADE